MDYSSTIDRTTMTWTGKAVVPGTLHYIVHVYMYLYEFMGVVVPELESHPIHNQGPDHAMR